MKKNGLLTFLCACIPGAGQMYYGYMQRGLSLITAFIGCFFLGWLADPLSLTMAIVWMYSFFDTYDLIRHLAAGTPKPDGLLILGDVEAFKRLIPQHNRLLGGGLIALGVYALYHTALRPLLTTLLEHLGVERAWRVLDAIPTVAVALLLIAAGLWLLGIHPGKTERQDEMPPYPRVSLPGQPRRSDDEPNE